MNTYELFSNINELPEVLSDEETRLLFIQSKTGSIKARNKIIEHNIRLVLMEVLKKYKRIKCDKRELVCVGVMGLINAVNTFDIERNLKFSTYAVKCIDNEVNHLLYHLNKDTILDSMEKPVYTYSDGDEIKLKDILPYDLDIEEEYIKKESLMLINNIISELPERKRKMIQMYYGLGEYKDKKFKQKEIALELGLERSYMAHVMRDTLNDIKYQLKTRHNNDIQKVRTM